MGSSLSLLIKLFSMKLEPWFILCSFILLRLLCNSINLPYSYACVWAGAPSWNLELLDSCKSNMQDCWSFTCCLFWTLHLLSKCSQLKSFLYILFWYILLCLVPLPYSRGRPTRYSDRLDDFSVTTPRCYKDVYINSFFPLTAKL